MLNFKTPLRISKNGFQSGPEDDDAGACSDDGDRIYNTSRAMFADFCAAVVCPVHHVRVADCACARAAWFPAYLAAAPAVGALREQTGLSEAAAWAQWAAGAGYGDGDDVTEGPPSPAPSTIAYGTSGTDSDESRHTLDYEAVTGEHSADTLDTLSYNSDAMSDSE